jgi:hypothetical protein
MATATQPQTCIECGHTAPGMVGYEIIPQRRTIWYGANWHCPDTDREACETRQQRQRFADTVLNLDV